MPRGFVWGRYVDNFGNTWALRVDADYATMDERGWDTTNITGLFPLPRGWLPRRVVGVDETGRLQSAISATTDSLLWSGLSSSFAIEANDGSLVICTVTGFEAERSQLPE